MAVNTVKEVGWLFRPWFWILNSTEEFKADTTNIKDLYKALPQKPALIAETSPATSVGPLSFLFGLFNTVIGLRKERSLVKIFGGLLSIASIGTAIAGRVFRVRFDKEEKILEGQKPKKTKLQLPNQMPPEVVLPTPVVNKTPEPVLPASVIDKTPEPVFPAVPLEKPEDEINEEPVVEDDFEDITTLDPVTGEVADYDSVICLLGADEDPSFDEFEAWLSEADSSSPHEYPAIVSDEEVDLDDLLKDYGEQIESLVERSEEEWLSFLRNPPNAIAKNEAIERLASVSNSNEALRALEEVLLADKNIDFRFRAARSLLKMQHPSALPALVCPLIRRFNESQEPILQALIEQRNLPNVFLMPLEHCLKSKNLKVRSLAANALGRTNNPEATSLLVKILETGDEEEVILNTLYGLALLKDAKAVPTLIKLLGDKSPRVRECGVVALASIGDERAVKELIKKLQDKNEIVRYQAARALGNMKAREALSALEKRFSCERSDFVKRMIQEATQIIQNS